MLTRRVNDESNYTPGFSDDAAHITASKNSSAVKKQKRKRLGIFSRSERGGGNLAPCKTPCPPHSFPICLVASCMRAVKAFPASAPLSFALYTASEQRVYNKPVPNPVTAAPAIVLVRTQRTQAAASEHHSSRTRAHGGARRVSDLVSLGGGEIHLHDEFWLPFGVCRVEYRKELPARRTSQVARKTTPPRTG